jgi:hypothetical protein
MDLDSAPEPGVELIRGPRRLSEVVPGYVIPIGFAVAVVVGPLVAVRRPSVGWALAGMYMCLAVALLVLAAVMPFTVRRQRFGRELGAGLPLAELGPTGARLRYELPTPRERRTGERRSPRYDAAVAWSDVTGWRRGIDPFGAPVLILEVADPARVTVRGRTTTLVKMYLNYLREGIGTTAVIRVPAPPAEQAAVAFLRKRGLPESPAVQVKGWPVDGTAIVRRGVGEMSGGRAWPARSLREIFGLSNPNRR